MVSKWVTVTVGGEAMEFEVLVPEDFTEDEAIEYAIDYAIDYVLSEIQVEVV